MKKLYLLFACFFLLSTSQLNAQWTSVGTGIDASPRAVWTLAIPDTNTVWAVIWDDQNIIATNEFARTTDGGQSWQTGTIEIDANLYAGQSFALDSMTMWLTSTDLNDPISGKIYKTNDGGQSWIHQSTAFIGFNETPMVVHFFNENEGVSFGATSLSNFNDQIAIYTTTNGGELWEKVEGLNLPAQLPGEGMTEENSNALYSVHGNTIWFPSNLGRVFKSSDRGLTWEVFDAEMEGSTPHDPIAIAMQDETTGILVSNDPNEALKTTDGGETWMPLDLPFTAQKSKQIRYIPGTPGTYLIHDGWNDQSTTAFLTLDGGDNWELIQTNATLACFEFVSPTVGYGGGNIINADLGGVYKWDGGGLVSNQAIYDQENKIDLFPNPVLDYLQLDFKEELQVEKITIYNSAGQLFFSDEVQNFSSSYSIETKYLPAGIYHVQINTSRLQLSKNFVKL